MNTEQTTHAASPAETGDHRPAATREEDRFITPPVDIFETPEGLTVVADLPGASRENIEIEVEKGVLTLKARSRHILASGDVRHQEFALADYFRQFQLGDVVDQERISAGFKHGVLTLHLPKMQAAKPRKVTVAGV